MLFRWLLRLTDSPDRQVLGLHEVRATITTSLRESARMGQDGLFHELSIDSMPWGFDLADIPISIQSWHGTADRVVPSLHSRYLTSRLARCDAYFLRGEGHSSLLINHREDILDRLIADRGPPQWTEDSVVAVFFVFTDLLPRGCFLACVGFSGASLGGSGSGSISCFSL